MAILVFAFFFISKRFVVDPSVLSPFYNLRTIHSGCRVRFDLIRFAFIQCPIQLQSNAIQSNPVLFHSVCLSFCLSFFLHREEVSDFTRNSGTHERARIISYNAQHHNHNKLCATYPIMANISPGAANPETSSSIIFVVFVVFVFVFVVLLF